VTLANLTTGGWIWLAWTLLAIVNAGIAIKLDARKSFEATVLAVLSLAWLLWLVTP
jgi:hypothetical protein